MAEQTFIFVSAKGTQLQISAETYDDAVLKLREKDFDTWSALNNIQQVTPSVKSGAHQQLVELLDTAYEDLVQRRKIFDVYTPGVKLNGMDKELEDEIWDLWGPLAEDLIGYPLNFPSQYSDGKLQFNGDRFGYKNETQAYSDSKLKDGLILRGFLDMDDATYEEISDWIIAAKHAQEVLTDKLSKIIVEGDIEAVLERTFLNNIDMTAFIPITERELEDEPWDETDLDKQKEFIKTEYVSFIGDGQADQFRLINAIMQQVIRETLLGDELMKMIAEKYDWDDIIIQVVTPGFGGLAKRERERLLYVANNLASLHGSVGPEKVYGSKGSIDKGLKVASILDSITADRGDLECQVGDPDYISFATKLTGNITDLEILQEEIIAKSYLKGLITPIGQLRLLQTLNRFNLDDDDRVANSNIKNGDIGWGFDPKENLLFEKYLAGGYGLITGKIYTDVNADNKYNTKSPWTLHTARVPHPASGEFVNRTSAILVLDTIAPASPLIDKLTSVEHLTRYGKAGDVTAKMYSTTKDTIFNLSYGVNSNGKPFKVIKDNEDSPKRKVLTQKECPILLAEITERITDTNNKIENINKMLGGMNESSDKLFKICEFLEDSINDINTVGQREKVLAGMNEELDRLKHEIQVIEQDKIEFMGADSTSTTMSVDRKAELLNELNEEVDMSEIDEL